tara:strand:+ start:3082 stop:5922 length:2841 start_codon:yes stop_codon:yes gene_type:complete
MPRNSLKRRNRNSKKKSLRKIKRRSSKKYNKKGGNFSDMFKHPGYKKASDEQVAQYFAAHEGDEVALNRVIRDNGKIYLPSFAGNLFRGIRNSPKNIKTWATRNYEDMKTKGGIFKKISADAKHFKGKLGQKLSDMRSGLKATLSKMIHGFTNLFKKADKKAQHLEDKFEKQKSELKSTLSRMSKLEMCMRKTISGNKSDSSGHNIRNDIVAKLKKKDKGLFKSFSKFIGYNKTIKKDKDEYGATDETGKLKIKHSQFDSYIATLVTEIYDCTSNDNEKGDLEIESKVQKINNLLDKLSKEYQIEKAQKKVESAAEQKIRYDQSDADFDAQSYETQIKSAKIDEINKMKKDQNDIIKKLNKEKKDLQTKMDESEDKKKFEDLMNAKDLEIKNAKEERSKLDLETVKVKNTDAIDALEKQAKEVAQEHDKTQTGITEAAQKEKDAIRDHVESLERKRDEINKKLELQNKAREERNKAIIEFAKAEVELKKTNGDTSSPSFSSAKTKMDSTRDTVIKKQKEIEDLAKEIVLLQKQAIEDFEKVEGASSSSNATNELKNKGKGIIASVKDRISNFFTFSGTKATPENVEAAGSKDENEIKKLQEKEIKEITSEAAVTNTPGLGKKVADSFMNIISYANPFSYGSNDKKDDQKDEEEKDEEKKDIKGGGYKGAYHAERMNKLRFYFDLKKYQYGGGGTNASKSGTPVDVQIRQMPKDKKDVVMTVVDEIEGLCKKINENIKEKSGKLMSDVIVALKKAESSSSSGSKNASSDDGFDLGMYDEIIKRVGTEIDKSSNFMLQLNLSELIRSYRKMTILNKIKLYIGEANLQLHKLVYGAKHTNWKSNYNMFKDKSHKFVNKALNATSKKIKDLMDWNKNASENTPSIEEIELGEKGEKTGGSKSFSQTLKELQKLNKKAIKDYNQYGGMLKKSKRSLNKSRKRSQKSRKRRR